MRILHVFRTPVGGLFRHVRDLAKGQSELGHEAGILCDSTTGGTIAEQLLASVKDSCSLGIKRIPISRLPGAGDLSGAHQTTAYARELKPTIIHCHGAKGGLYGRIAAKRLGIASVYTAHGGSLHYQWNTPSGFAFLAAEKMLAAIGSGIHFVCDYERSLFDKKIGVGNTLHAVIHNGLWPDEFTAAKPDADAADLLFIGDMRMIKGVDILLEALALSKGSRPITACMVGDGPDLQRFKDQSAKLGLDKFVSFPGRMPAAEAFKRGRLLVMPSRAESFPYVVLEAVAAQVPMIASKVGGIPEALEETQLFPPENAEALARAIQGKLADPALLARNASAQAERFKKQFSAQTMVARIEDFYRRAIG